ncbi:MAG: hypothetical protein QME51_00410 [Planctomycetota bacterium]|nr:hypothetical protein [Planctomycetota bacterium]MDI6786822.1 hypothetical protein [Planctomycetota bacterium]
MFNLICDRCGRGLLINEDVRYEVTVEIKSAYDPMEITDEDLRRNFTKDLARLLKVMEDKTEEELQDEVYKIFRFDICLQCQKELLKNPLFISKSGCPISRKNAIF